MEKLCFIYYGLEKCLIRTQCIGLSFTGELVIVTQQ